MNQKKGFIFMKTNTLYISDLDGTLLAPDGYISDRSRDILNNVIKDGAKVSIATSRNLFAFDQRVSGVDFSIPVILNTGGCIYNCQTRHYDVISDIPFDSVLKLKKILDENAIASFIYGLVDEELYLLYEGLFDDADQAYIRKRGPLYHTFQKDLASLSEMADCCKVIFFVGYGSYEKTKRILDFCALVDGIKATITKDIYTENYFIEICEASVSKASAILKLKEMYEIDEVVAFGDNVNDVEMLELSDRCYVPESGLAEIREMADVVIEGNDTDSVARFIAEDYYR